MSRKRNDDLHLKNAIRGINLTEAIEKSGIRPAELLRRASEQSTGYFAMSPQTLSQIMHGHRPLKYDDALIFADILGVDVDYLMGKDGALMKYISAQEKEARKYTAILNQVGSNIVAYESTKDENGNDTIVSYTISYNHRPYDPEEAAARLEEIISNHEDDEDLSFICIPGNFDAMNVSVEEMESLYQDVCKFIRKRLDILIALNEEEA